MALLPRWLAPLASEADAAAGLPLAFDFGSGGGGDASFYLALL